MEEREKPATRPIKPLKRGRRASQTPPIMAHNPPPPGSQNSAVEQLHEHAPRVEAAEQSAFASHMSSGAEAAEKSAFASSMRSPGAAEQSAFASRMSNSAGAAEKPAFTSRMRTGAGAAEKPAFAPPMMRYNVTDEASKQRHASAAAPGPSAPGGSSPPLVRRRDPSEYMSETERIQAGRRALLEQREEEGAKQDELMRRFKALMMVPPPLKARQAASSKSAPGPSEPSGLHRAQCEDASDASDASDTGINLGTAEEARLIEESHAEAEERESAAREEDEMLLDETPHKTIESLQAQLEAATKKVAELVDYSNAIIGSLFDERARANKCRSAYECKLTQVREQRDKFCEDRKRFKKLITEKHNPGFEIDDTDDEYVRSDDEAPVWEDASDAKDEEEEMEDEVAVEAEVEHEMTPRRATRL